MTLEFVTEYLNKKIAENENYLVCTVYDLRVRNDVKENEVDDFLRLARTRLENMNYQVYFTGARYTFQSEKKVVGDNEYMVAIKEL